MFPICFSGPESEAERAFAPLRKLGTPLADEIRSVDYVAVQRSGDINDPRAEGAYLKSGFITKFPPELVSALIDGFQGHPQRSTAVFFQQGGGAIARVPTSATALADFHARLAAIAAEWNTLGSDAVPQTVIEYESIEVKDLR